jgi:hypothetical protein
MRLFVHLHGQGVGNLTVYSRTGDGRMVELLKMEGSAPGSDINKWKRKKVGPIISCTSKGTPGSQVELEGIDQEINVIIEATVGIPGRGDIAIDDVSFTPQCT